MPVEPFEHRAVCRRIAAMAVDDGDAAEARPRDAVEDFAAEALELYGALYGAPISPEVQALMDKALSRKGVRYTSGQSKLSAAR